MGISDFGWPRAACQVCGAPGGARMGSTEWEPFDGMACNEKCGLAAQAALIALQKTKKYRRAEERIYSAKQRLSDMEREAIVKAAPRKGDAG